MPPSDWAITSATAACPCRGGHHGTRARAKPTILNAEPREAPLRRRLGSSPTASRRRQLIGHDRTLSAREPEPRALTLSGSPKRSVKRGQRCKTLVACVKGSSRRDHGPVQRHLTLPAAPTVLPRPASATRPGGVRSRIANRRVRPSVQGWPCADMPTSGNGGNDVDRNGRGCRAPRFEEDSGDVL